MWHQTSVNALSTRVIVIVLGPWLWYDRLMSEGAFQEKLLATARSEGYVAKRFSDSVGVGIADTFIGSLDYGVWLECKWRDGWPKKAKTPMLTLGDKGVRGSQVEFLASMYLRPNDAGVIIGLPGEWVVVPAPAVWLYITQNPSSFLRSFAVKGFPTLALVREAMSKWCKK